jgi:hypothetical protein
VWIEFSKLVLDLTGGERFLNLASHNSVLSLESTNISSGGKVHFLGSIGSFMPSAESPWHADLEAALAGADFGLPEGYELAWQMLPPFDDWIISISAHGHAAAVLVTAHQMTLSEQLVDLLEENAAGRLIKILAVPSGKTVSPEVELRIGSGSIHLLRYGDN